MISPEKKKAEVFDENLISPARLSCLHDASESDSSTHLYYTSKYVDFVIKY